ncbi:MAG: hypothetical protein R3A52_02085 [Polyangiales bacterium]
MQPRRQAFFAFVSLALLGAGYATAGLLQDARPATPAPGAAPAPVRLRRNHNFAETTIQPPYIPEADALRESLDAPLRLRPDQRFVLAAALLGARDLDHRWNDGWDLSLAAAPDRALAHVDALPTFESLLVATATCAGLRVEAAPAPAPTTEAAPAPAPTPIEAAPEPAPDARPHRRRHHASRHAGRRHRRRVVPASAPAMTPPEAPAVAPAATSEALSRAWTFAVTDDLLGGADPLAAWALAAVIRARASGHRDLDAEAVLADAMGYRAEALALARQAQDLTARAWVRRDLSTLSRRASEGDARAAVMLLRAQAERDDGAGVAATLERHLGGDATRPELAIPALDRFHGPDALDARRADALTLTARVVERAVTALAPEARAPADAAPFARVDLALRGCSDGDDPGRCAARAARLRALSATALWRAVLVPARSLRVPAEAEAILTSAGAATDPFLSQALAWAGERVAVEDHRDLDPDALSAHPTRFPLLGHTPLSMSTDAALDQRMVYSLPAQRDVERLAAALDGRPAHRAAVGSLLAAQAVDVLRGRRLTASAMAAAPGDYVFSEAFALRRSGDLDALLALSRERDRPLPARIAALRAVDATGDAGRRADEAWEALERDEDDDYTVVLAHLRWLASHDRHADVRARARRWLTAHPAATGFDRLLISEQMASASIALGHPDEAWEALGPLTSSWQGNVMETAALALSRLGQHDEAEAMMARVADRYGLTPRTAATQAELRWRRGAHAAAARGLARVFAGEAQHAAWQEFVTPAFAAVFGDGRDVGEAVDAVCAAGIAPVKLLALGQGLGRRGLAGVGAAVLERAQAQGGDRLEQLAAAWDLKRRGPGGEPVATQWIRAQVPAGARPMFSMIAYGQGLDPLLWEVAEPGGDGEGAEMVWLLRTAASVRRGPADPHRAELMDHAQSGGSASRYRVMSRYLLGLDDVSVMPPLGQSPRPATEVAYYLGVAAEARGDVTLAHDWYRRAVLVGSRIDGEWRWAINRLAELRGHPALREAARP